MRDPPTFHIWKVGELNRTAASTVVSARLCLKMLCAALSMLALAPPAPYSGALISSCAPWPGGMHYCDMDLEMDDHPSGINR